MNRQQFKETLEKLELRNPRTVEVLRMVLAKCTDAEIAKSLDIHQGTVRKHIEKLYAAFGIKSKFEGDRRSKRGDLREPFAQYKPEWVSDYPSTVTNNVSNEQEQVNQNSVCVPVSLSMKKSEAGEYLMSLATRILEQSGFDQKFKVCTTSEYIGYRLKNTNQKEIFQGYQLVLSPCREGLHIYVNDDLLTKHLLFLRFSADVEEERVHGRKVTYSGIRERVLWVRPSKEDIFLEISLRYKSIMHGESVGGFNLDQLSNVDCDYEEMKSFHKSFLNSIDNSECCLDVQLNDRTFRKTILVIISSSEVLAEFINFLRECVFINNNKDERYK
ncbi:MULTISPECIES: helix-turn-helix transcriptional regulator [Cyanophyceae]|uniref:helix-turn-helix transcriptional regulator n=1 Tax=Cyanophyceae TaxID=3028117 RepID=UPI00168455E5|nr:helix-turn-helix transcriptional regulator [Trichocoleus sp. FACHB-40]MBD2003374.1 helix-turn-helix transcriptional regulator [Trichocoleus sp. FACHB-40]